jgi:hypothetical protein
MQTLLQQAGSASPGALAAFLGGHPRGVLGHSTVQRARHVHTGCLDKQSKAHSDLLGFLHGRAR